MRLQWEPHVVWTWFTGRFRYSTPIQSLPSTHLVVLLTLGDTHRKQRKILNPVFSNAQMRNLAPIFYSLSQQVCTTSTSSFPSPSNHHGPALRSSRAYYRYLGIHRSQHAPLAFENLLGNHRGSRLWVLVWVVWRCRSRE